MTDETDPGPPPARPDAAPAPAVGDPSQTWDPGAAPGAAPTDPATPPAAALPSISSALITEFWSGLGPAGQLVIGGALALIVVSLLGAIVNAWEDSGTLVGLVLFAAGAAGGTGMLRERSDFKPSQIPLETIEFASGVVATALAGLRVIEVVFDFDDLEGYGGVFGAILTVAMLIAAGAILVGAVRRDPTLRTAALAPDRGTRLAVAGLALVLIGWALNLSVGFWNMNAAATSVALLAFGAVLVVVQDRWKSVLPEVPLGWVGAGFAVVSLLLAIDQFGALGRLGIRTELGLTDYVPFLVYVLGIVAIIAGGILAGMPTWKARPKAPAPAIVTPPTTAPAAAAAPAAPGPSTAPAAAAEPATLEPPAAPSEPPAPPA